MPVAKCLLYITMATKGQREPEQLFNFQVVQSNNQVQVNKQIRDLNFKYWTVQTIFDIFKDTFVCVKL